MQIAPHLATGLQLGTVHYLKDGKVPAFHRDNRVTAFAVFLYYLTGQQHGDACLLIWAKQIGCAIAPVRFDLAYGQMSLRAFMCL